MIVVTVFLSILNQIEFHLVQNRKENSPHDHIPLKVKAKSLRKQFCQCKVAVIATVTPFNDVQAISLRLANIPL